MRLTEPFFINELFKDSSLKFLAPIARLNLSTKSLDISFKVIDDLYNIIVIYLYRLTNAEKRSQTIFLIIHLRKHNTFYPIGIASQSVSKIQS